MAHDAQTTALNETTTTHTEVRPPQLKRAPAGAPTPTEALILTQLYLDKD
ncbi:hypothetical protein [Actinomadura sp. 6N118]